MIVVDTLILDDGRAVLYLNTCAFLQTVNSVMDKELKIDLRDIAGDDGDEDEDVRLTSDSAIDELMSALDALEGHADDSIQANRDTEMYWITTLNERDELILSNKKSISELQRLNRKLQDENQMLRQQLSSSDQSEVVTALQDDASRSRNLSMQVSVLIRVKILMQKFITEVFYIFLSNVVIKRPSFR